jgi:hypothetical protein
MDKALIVFLLFISSFKNINAQSWQEVNMGQNSVFLSINPFDSSFWLKTSYPIHFDDGVFTHYTPAVVPLFNFVDFSWTYRRPVFSSSAMYSYNDGAPFFYKFDGNTFQTIDLPGEHQMHSFGNMVVRNDTLYMGTWDPNNTYTLVYFQDQLINTYQESHSNLLVGENALCVKPLSFKISIILFVRYDLPVPAIPSICNEMPLSKISVVFVIASVS